MCQRIGDIPYFLPDWEFSYPGRSWELCQECQECWEYWVCGFECVRELGTFPIPCPVGNFLFQEVQNYVGNVGNDVGNVRNTGFVGFQSDKYPQQKYQLNVYYTADHQPS